MPANVRERDAVARDDGHLFVVEEDDVARVAEDGRDVGGDEELAVAEADDDRRAVARRRRSCPGRRSRCSTIAKSPRRRASARRTAALEAVAAHLALDEVRDDLGVGLGDERVALRAASSRFRSEVVLDDAVVDDDDAAGAVAVRVRVLFGRPAVRRPARVAEAVLARRAGLR